MAEHPIVRLAAKSFGPLEDVDLDLSPQLNIITGDNATGKSQLLKLMYANTNALASAAPATKTALGAEIAESLSGVFKPDSLGRLARRVRGRSRAEVTVKYRGIGDPLEYGFSSVARTDVQVVSFPRTDLRDTPVFFPSRELLSLYPGLVALYESREVEFDQTWRDTAVLLGRSALRGPRSEDANRLLQPILDEIEGSVIEENGRFYVRLPSGGEGTGKIEAHLVSEGFRKLAMIIRLVSNGVLLEGGYLFWDEPEANLNPRTQRAVARAILTLAASGTQVFVATHSLFLLREFELMTREGGTSVDTRYIGLYRESGSEAPSISSGVRGESAQDLDDLSAVAALEAETAQNLEYMGL